MGVENKWRYLGFFALFACSLYMYYITDIEVNYMQIEIKTWVKLSKYIEFIYRVQKPSQDCLWLGPGAQNVWHT